VGTITAGAMIDRAAQLLYDQTNIKWSRTELLEHLNSGQRVITLTSPTSNNTVAVMQLVIGARQSLPSDGWLLLDVIRNMGTDGLTPGRSVRVISRKLLEAFDPDWQTSTKKAVVQSYWFDLQDQTAFFVYPPADGTSRIEINYSATPPALISEAQTISLRDVMDSALLNWMCFRALSKTAEFGGAELGAAYLGAFNAIMGSKYTAEQANNPNFGLFPPSADVKGGVS